MTLTNCVRCGKIFTKEGIKPICPACLEKDDQAVDIVRDFIKENPNCKLDDVVEATEVSRKTIIRLLREKRIELVEGSAPLLECEKCGKPIFAGQYCNDCLIDIGKTLQGAIPKSDTNNKPLNWNSKSKMHITKKFN